MNELYNDIYRKIVMSELSKPKSEQYSVVRCKHCGGSDSTLFKINDEYVCKNCKNKERKKDA